MPRMTLGQSQSGREDPNLCPLTAALPVTGSREGFRGLSSSALWTAALPVTGSRRASGAVLQVLMAADAEAGEQAMYSIKSTWPSLSVTRH